MLRMWQWSMIPSRNLTSWVAQCSVDPRRPRSWASKGGKEGLSGQYHGYKRKIALESWKSCSALTWPLQSGTHGVEYWIPSGQLCRDGLGTEECELKPLEKRKKKFQRSKFKSRQNLIFFHIIYSWILDWYLEIHNHHTSCDSSVGRVLDWRSKGPRFDPGLQQCLFLFLKSYTIY